MLPCPSLPDSAAPLAFYRYLPTLALEALKLPFFLLLESDPLEEPRQQSTPQSYWASPPLSTSQQLQLLHTRTWLFISASADPAQDWGENHTGSRSIFVERTTVSLRNSNSETKMFFLPSGRAPSIIQQILSSTTRLPQVYALLQLISKPPDFYLFVT